MLPRKCSKRMVAKTALVATLVFKITMVTTALAASVCYFI